MVPRILILRAALIVAALLALGGEANAQCTGQPPGNQVCASPNGAAGLPGFRALVGADIPVINPPIAVNTTVITGGTDGLIGYQAAGKFSQFTMAGDCTFAAPNVTCTKTGGASFALSATQDTTNATNISSGTLNSARVDQATAANFMAAAANKMLPADKVFTTETAVTQTTTTLALDFSQFINVAVTLQSPVTTITFSNVKAGQAGLIRFVQDGTGSRTIPTTINSTMKCAGGCSYTLTTTAGASDVIGYTCVSATYCVGGSLLKDVK